MQRAVWHYTLVVRFFHFLCPFAWISKHSLSIKPNPLRNSGESPFRDARRLWEINAPGAWWIAFSLQHWAAGKEWTAAMKPAVELTFAQKQNHRTNLNETPPNGRQHGNAVSRTTVCSWIDCRVNGVWIAFGARIWFQSSPSVRSILQFNRAIYFRP